jgi:hypothetical protein
MLPLLLLLVVDHGLADRSISGVFTGGSAFCRVGQGSRLQESVSHRKGFRSQRSASNEVLAASLLLISLIRGSLGLDVWLSRPAQRH